jgi:hypothetical protein
MGDLINYPTATASADLLNNLQKQINFPGTNNSFGLSVSTGLRDVVEAFFAAREGTQSVRHHGKVNKQELMRQVMKTRSELTQYRLRNAALPQDSPDVLKEKAYLDMMELMLAEDLRELGFSDGIVDGYA